MLQRAFKIPALRPDFCKSGVGVHSIRRPKHRVPELIFRSIYLPHKEVDLPQLYVEIDQTAALQPFPESIDGPGRVLVDLLSKFIESGVGFRCSLFECE